MHSPRGVAFKFPMNSQRSALRWSSRGVCLILYGARHAEISSRHPPFLAIAQNCDKRGLSGLSLLLEIRLKNGTEENFSKLASGSIIHTGPENLGGDDGNRSTPSPIPLSLEVFRKNSRELSSQRQVPAKQEDNRKS